MQKSLWVMLHYTKELGGFTQRLISLFFCSSYICYKAFECKILKVFLFGLQGGVGITILYVMAFILSTLKSTEPGILLNM